MTRRYRKIINKDKPRKRRPKISPPPLFRTNTDLNIKNELFIALALSLNEGFPYSIYGPGNKGLAGLVSEVSTTDPLWVKELIQYIRGYEKSGLTVGMKSFQLAAYTLIEFLAATRECSPRAMIYSLCQSGHEAFYLIDQWLRSQKKGIPMALKRGVADALQSLCTEELFFDLDEGIADTIELTHPVPRNEEQSSLFRHLIDRRHGRLEPSSNLSLVQDLYNFEELSLKAQREYIVSHPRLAITASFKNWMSLYANGPLWEKIIPHLDYVDLINNINTIDAIGISLAGVRLVRDRITRKEDIYSSGCLPYTFLDAYKGMSSLTYAPALEAALEYSINNIAKIQGKTLILLDVSLTMKRPIDPYSNITREQVGAIFAASIMKRAEKCDWFIYGSRSKKVTPARSFLHTLNIVGNSAGTLGSSAETFKVAGSNFDNHDRIIIISDMNNWSYNYSDLMPSINCPIYTYIIGGAGIGGYNGNSPYGRYTFSQINNHSFAAMKFIEEGRAGQWQWERNDILEN